MGKASTGSGNFGKTLAPWRNSCPCWPELRWRRLRLVPGRRRRVRCGLWSRSLPVCGPRGQGARPSAQHSAWMERVSGEDDEGDDEEERAQRHHGAMAPRNTTQYLMRIAAPDSGSDFLDYQLRDFEEACGELRLGPAAWGLRCGRAQVPRSSSSPESPSGLVSQWRAGPPAGGAPGPERPSELRAAPSVFQVTEQDSGEAAIQAGHESHQCPHHTVRYIY
ncbi:uncharacterized protein ACB058_017417 isoform 2-T2 [Synchiropus picturatus]